MKRPARPALDMEDRAALFKREVRVRSGVNAKDEWERYRSTVSGRRVAAAFAAVSGVRNRCMYCRDSRSRDIDHFSPVALFPGLTFRWRNYVWSCPICNTSKSTRFPILNGKRLLLNPFDDNFWDFFIFDITTGEVSPRWRSQTQEDPRALATLEVFSALRDEAVTEGRKISALRLVRSATAMSSGGDASACRDLVQEFQREEYGVAAWFTRYEGSAAAPWAGLKAAKPVLWRRLVALST